MADDLEELMNKVSIGDDEEEEEEVFIDDQWVNDSKCARELSLVGKMLLCKPFKFEDMHTTFIKAWRISGKFDVKEGEDHLFLFCFESRIDKARALLKQPWSFNKSLLVLMDMMI
ncbi:hypothetical protein PTKIN_Ptkin18bG0033500 [Pterospermum kingtungense]